MISIRNVRPALAIAADEEIGAREKGDVGGLVITEIREAQMCDDHAVTKLFRLVDRVSAELVTQGGNRLHRGRTIGLTRNEPGEDGRTDRWHRHGVREGFLDSPPSFT